MATALAQGHMDSNEQTTKTRAACEECRTRKLKCSGERPCCSRCQSENITCFYSPQKQMGRPKKRQRQDHDECLEVETDLNDLLESAVDAGPHDEALVAGGLLESGLTPGGATWQTWLQRTDIDWPLLDSSMQSQSHTESIPDLISDSSSRNSPPILNLPPEIRSSYQSARHENTTTHSPLVLDTILATSDLNYSSLQSCACLSSLYLALNNVQSQSLLTFPSSLHPLRTAMRTAATVLTCESCPKRFITGMQNTQLLSTLFISIAESFGKVLTQITTEAERASQQDETKRFRLADLNHLGGIGCAGAFSVNLSPQEWRDMCKKVVRSEVEGPSSDEGSESLLGLVSLMEARQIRWHQGVVPEDFPRDEAGELLGGPRDRRCEDGRQEDHMCLRMVGIAKKMVEGYDWS